MQGIGATYDALGRMVETNNSGTYTQYVYRPSGDKLGAFQAGAIASVVVPLPGGLTAVYNASGLNYIRHMDYLGSSRLATMWNHTVYSKEAYAPFGEAYNEGGQQTDRVFTGQEQSTKSGIYDYMFRKYDPTAGRRLSSDPAGWGAVDPAYPQSLDRYAYTVNNPMSATDPTGMACVYANASGVSVDNSEDVVQSSCLHSGGNYVPGSVDYTDLAPTGVDSAGNLSYVNSPPGGATTASFSVDGNAYNGAEYQGQFTDAPTSDTILIYTANQQAAYSGTSYDMAYGSSRASGGGGAPNNPQPPQPPNNPPQKKMHSPCIWVDAAAIGLDSIVLFGGQEELAPWAYSTSVHAFACSLIMGD